MQVVGVASAGLITAAFAVRCALPRALSNKYAIWLTFVLVAQRGVLQASLAALRDTVATQAVEYALFEVATQLRGVGVAALLFAAFTAERVWFARSKHGAGKME